MIRTGKLPFFSRGQTVVLFGGSFDPPHAGHRLVAQAALAQLQADFVWWLVSPQNPLKAHRPGAQSARVAATQGLARHPKFIVNDAETRLGTRYAVDTVRALKAAHPGVHFIWLIGADNLAQMHKWKDWQALMGEIAMAVYPRPGATLKALAGKAALRFGAQRLPSAEAAQLGRRPAPAWTLLRGVQSSQSSTALRKAQNQAPAK